MQEPRAAHEGSVDIPLPTWENKFTVRSRIPGRRASIVVSLFGDCRVGLQKCKECQSQVSSKAKTCPHCGAPVKTETNPAVAAIAGIIVLGLFIFFCSGLYDLGSSDSSSSRPKTTSRSTQSKWYVGGTLHRATMREWYGATYKNRLATCGDLVASVMKIEGKTVSSMDGLKKEAVNLEVCISEAGADRIADRMDLSAIAAACWLLMKGE